MSSVRIVFDVAAFRWELVRDGLAGTADLVELAQGVQVARSASGEVVELLADVDEPGAPSSMALDLVSEAFGWAIASLLRTLDPSDGVDLVLDLGLAVPAGSAVSGAKPGGPNGPMVGEPGALVARADGCFEVSLEGWSAQVEVTPIALVVTVPGIGVDGWWVRVSDSGSGALLAMGPLRPDVVAAPSFDGHTDDRGVAGDVAGDGSGDGSGSRRGGAVSTVAAAVAEITFGLEVDPETTLVTITTDPLHPVPPRLQRRLAWVDALTATARRVTRTHPSQAVRDARRAADAAAQLGEQERRREAESIVRRARRWRLVRPLAVVLVLGAVAAIVLGAWFGGGDVPVGSGDSSPEPTGVLPDDGELALEAFAGPATYVFGDEASVRLVLVGAVTVEQGQAMLLDAVGTLTVPAVDFGDRSGVASPGDEEAARSNCLGAVNVSAALSTFVAPLDTEVFVALESLDGGGSIGVGRVAIAGAVRSVSSDPGSCRAAEMFDDGRFLARAVATRDAEVVQFEVPVSLPPGRWRVTLSVDELTGEADSPLVIDVVPN